jgi:hypothetical protein
LSSQKDGFDSRWEDHAGKPVVSQKGQHMSGQFMLADLPQYKYPLNLACPECYSPLYTRKTKDGRCDSCLKNKSLLPVNWRRPPKKKEEEEEETY